MKTKELDTNKLIQQVADHKAVASFVENFVKPENLEERQLNGLGIAIAAWADWEGNKILEVFKYALEDANYHDLAQQVQNMIDN